MSRDHAVCLVPEQAHARRRGSPRLCELANTDAEGANLVLVLIYNDFRQPQATAAL